MLQPAFDQYQHSKISWPSTAVCETKEGKRENLLRYASFVEVTCPLIARQNLTNFLEKAYDEKLSGYGIDIMLADFLRPPEGKVAVVDAVSCVNPPDASRGAPERLGGGAAGPAPGLGQLLRPGAQLPPP